MNNSPSPNGENGRLANGQFAKGNSGGPGNPRPRQAAALRAILLDTVTDDDLRAVTIKLVELAKGGDLPAIRELLDRVLGKVKATVELIDDGIDVFDTLYGERAMVESALDRDPDYLEYLQHKRLGKQEHS